ncbi:MAG: carbohydrate ABC transporter permease [Spirochaetaceae bacterium]|nr:carbohydrate ABC transporter permease [Spirochaetaceae bacterium]
MKKNLSAGRQSRKIKKAGTVCLTALVLLISLVWLAPLYITAVNSFAPPAAEESAAAQETQFIKISLLPSGFSLEQYSQLLIRTPVYLTMFWNSVLITLSVALGSVLASLLGAYGFTVLRFRGKDIIFLIYIIAMLLPLQVTLMPNYMTASFLGIENSYLAVILPAVFNPFGVFLLRQQMKILPYECTEAAKIDGAGHPQIFFYITLPMVKSGIAAVLMLTAIEYWNLIDQAIVFIKKFERYPMSMFLSRINQEMSGLSFAAATFYVMPILALLLYGHEYIKNGIGLISAKER